MLIQEVIDLFLYNRRNGLAGSKGKAAANTLTTYRYSLEPFSAFMETRGKVVYQEIGVSDVRAYVEHLNDLLTEGKWSKSHFLICVKVLKCFFKFVETDDDCKEDELKSFRTKLPVSGAFPRRDYIPSPADLKEWKRAFKAHTVLGLRNWVMFCVFMETGIRRAELCGLKLDHLQLDNHQIYVSGKTGSRNVVITEILARNVRLYLKKRAKSNFADSEYLFASCKNSIPQPNMVTKVFASMRRRAKLPYLTPHTMRHAFCTYYLKRGGNTERLRNMTGHKTYTAMLHYMHLAKVGGTEQKEELERVSPLRMLDES